MKFFILVVLITQTIFSMNLTLSEANKAMRYLRGAKGVLLYENNQFKYIPISSVSKEKGYIKAFGYNNDSAILHEDDYHININGTPMDLTKIYYRVGNSKKWVSVGSEIHYFKYRKNSTIYIYKQNEKIPSKLKKTGKKVEVIDSIGDGKAKLIIDEEDAKYNGADVVLERHQSF